MDDLDDLEKEVPTPAPPTEGGGDTVVEVTPSTRRNLILALIVIVGIIIAYVFYKIHSSSSASSTGVDVGSLFTSTVQAVQSAVAPVAATGSPKGVHLLPSPHQNTYDVRGGDTLTGIAKKEHVNLLSLEQLNKNTIYQDAAKHGFPVSHNPNDNIFPGEILILPNM